MKNLRLLCSTAILAATLPTSACRTFADTTMSVTSTHYDRSPLHHLGGSRSWQLRISGQRCRLDADANVYLLAGPGRRAALTDLGSGRFVRLDLDDSSYAVDNLRAYAESLVARDWYRDAPLSPDRKVHRLFTRTGERQRIAGLDCQRWVVRYITPPVEDKRRLHGAGAWSEQWSELWVADAPQAVREIAAFYARAAQGLPSHEETRRHVLDDLGAFLIDHGRSNWFCGEPMPEVQEALQGRLVVRALTISALQPSRRDLDRLLTDKRIRALARRVWGGGDGRVTSTIDSLFGSSAMEHHADKSSSWPGPHSSVTGVSVWSLDGIDTAWIPPTFFEVPPGFSERPKDDCCGCYAPLIKSRPQLRGVKR